MIQIITHLPDALLADLDAAATSLERSREEIIREAVHQYLEDFSDQSVALERLRDQNDPELDWESVRHDLFDND